MKSGAARYVKGYGCYVWIGEDGGLLGCEKGEFEDYGGRDCEWTYEITAPENQAFLDAVNELLGTEFKFEEFAGR
jgi:hypothetical protein